MGTTEHSTDGIGDTNTLWETIETWSVLLFLVGGVLELLFAGINGVAYLTDVFTYQPWIGLIVLLGRLAFLVGIAGLSVRVATRNPRLGRWGRVVVLLAIGFTSGLVILAALDDFGLFTSPIIAIFGLGSVVSTVVTFALFGVAILRTDAFSPLIGGLLVAAAITLVALFIGLEILAIPTRLAGAVGEGVFFVILLALWNVLRTESGLENRSDTTHDSTVE